MPIIQTARGLLQGAIGLFGRETRLDDVIPLIEKISAVRLAQDAPEREKATDRPPPRLTEADLVALLTHASAACNMMAVLEGIGVGMKLVLQIETMARVIDAGSAWSSLRRSQPGHFGLPHIAPNSRRWRASPSLQPWQAFPHARNSVFTLA